MANPNVPDPQNAAEYNKFVKSYEYWRRYNDPNIAIDAPNLDLQQYRAHYRLHDYVTTNPAANAPPPAPRAPQPIRQIVPPDPRPRNDEEREFLLRTIPEIMTDQQPKANWKGKRVLGKGGNAMVGLWSYDTSQPPPHPLYCDVAVKETSNSSYELAQEGFIMEHLGRSSSEHIVKLVSARREANPGEEQDTAWDGKVKRLIMEYCSEGTLHQLLDRRIASQQPFQENTLWMIFECLVDGITVMEYNIELITNNMTRKAELRPSFHRDADVQEHDFEFVHFDLKPANIMLENSRTHRDIPICKIGDFGVSVQIDPDPPWTDAVLHSLRRTGTRGFYAPEQFSPRWNARDWKTSGVCGEYSYKTNIWQVGLTMYLLTTLQFSLDHTKPYLPGAPLLGKPPGGRTYGQDLEQTPYSAALKELILSCLFEKPALRPTLEDLKTLVVAGIEVTRRQAAEPWSSFAAPEPMIPLTPAAAAIAAAAAAVPIAPPAPIIIFVPAPVMPVVPAPQAAVVAPAPAPAPAPPPPLVRTAVFKCSWTCGNKKRFPVTTAFPRCHLHANLQRFPII